MHPDLCHICLLHCLITHSIRLSTCSAQPPSGPSSIHFLCPYASSQSQHPRPLGVHTRRHTPRSTLRRSLAVPLTLSSRSLIPRRRRTPIPIPPISTVPAIPCISCIPSISPSPVISPPIGPRIPISVPARPVISPRRRRRAPTCPLSLDYHTSRR